jgi:UDP:flavonoid glycosyltransferase YjiC (YdhE family)
LWVAGSDWQLDYFIKTFPDIKYLPLKGYNVTYGKGDGSFMFSIGRQVPNLLKTIKDEHQWLQEQVETRGFAGVISDNRYGLTHTEVPCAMMTHQLMVRSGGGRWVDAWLQKLHYKYIEKFNNCWVVDVKGNPNLSWELGHPNRLPKNAAYIGLLSQIEKAKTDKEHLLILLSGPEPQRMILSDMLWAQVQAITDRQIIFVEGADNVLGRKDVPAHIKHYMRVTKEELQPMLNDAAMVVCRSGYSTLMDLAVLKKPAIVIPTPGQTEQEYLAKHLHKEGVFFKANQKGFNLKEALEDSNNFPYKTLDFGDGYSLYKQVINDWYHSLP